MVLVVILGTALLFIQRMKSRAVIEMVTYTTENVSGLDESSPVRFRGVPVGRVSAIRFDPLTTTIRIDFQVFHDRLTSIGASVRRVQDFAGLGEVRAQVVSNPITGDSYLLLDVPRNPPPVTPLGLHAGPPLRAVDPDAAVHGAGPAASGPGTC